MLRVPEKWFSVRGINSKNFSLVPFMRPIRLLALLLTLSALGGCASFATSRLADNLSGAILNQDDPETAKAGMPAYLVLVDSLIDGDPNNEKLLLAGSKLYGAYAAAFVKDPERARRLTRKSRDYADRALCRHSKHLCDLLEQSFDDFSANIGSLKDTDVPVLFTGAAAWAGWIQANSSNWDAIASLPKVKAMMARAVALDEAYSHGEAHLYLGVIDTLLPPALGGKPEEGRVHFERAIQISGGRDLMDKVEYARHYARITYNRPLHDRLLHEVLDADAVAPDLTLSNMLAKQQARELLASADSYF
jgi:TRAP transporter T-component